MIRFSILLFSESEGEVADFDRASPPHPPTYQFLDNLILAAQATWFIEKQVPTIAYWGLGERVVGFPPVAHGLIIYTSNKYLRSTFPITFDMCAFSASVFISTKWAPRDLQ